MGFLDALFNPRRMQTESAGDVTALVKAWLHATDVQQKRAIIQEIKRIHESRMMDGRGIELEELRRVLRDENYDVRGLPKVSEEEKARIVNLAGVFLVIPSNEAFQVLAGLAKLGLDVPPGEG